MTNRLMDLIEIYRSASDNRRLFFSSAGRSLSELATADRAVTDAAHALAEFLSAGYFELDNIFMKASVYEAGQSELADLWARADEADTSEYFDIVSNAEERERELNVDGAELFASLLQVLTEEQA